MVFLFVAPVALSGLTGCEQFDDCEESGDSKTTLTIANQSGMQVSIEYLTLFQGWQVFAVLEDGEISNFKIHCDSHLFARENGVTISEFGIDEEDPGWVIGPPL